MAEAIKRGRLFTCKRARSPASLGPPIAFFAPAWASAGTRLCSPMRRIGAIDAIAAWYYKSAACVIDRASAETVTSAAKAPDGLRPH